MAKLISHRPLVLWSSPKHGEPNSAKAWGGLFLPTQIVGQIGSASLCVDAVLFPQIVHNYNKSLAKTPLK